MQNRFKTLLDKQIVLCVTQTTGWHTWSATLQVLLGLAAIQWVHIIHQAIDKIQRHITYIKTTQINMNICFLYIECFSNCEWQFSYGHWKRSCVVYTYHLADMVVFAITVPASFKSELIYLSVSFLSQASQWHQLYQRSWDQVVS